MPQPPGALVQVQRQHTIEHADRQHAVQRRQVLQTLSRLAGAALFVHDPQHCGRRGRHRQRGHQRGGRGVDRKAGQQHIDAGKTEHRHQQAGSHHPRTGAQPVQVDAVAAFKQHQPEGNVGQQQHGLHRFRRQPAGQRGREHKTYQGIGTDAWQVHPALDDLTQAPGRQQGKGPGDVVVQRCDGKQWFSLTSCAGTRRSPFEWLACYEVQAIVTIGTNGSSSAWENSEIAIELPRKRVCLQQRLIQRPGQIACDRVHMAGLRRGLRRSRTQHTSLAIRLWHGLAPPGRGGRGKLRLQRFAQARRQ